MDKKKVAVYTLGCKVNQYESAAIAGMFEKRGYRVVEPENKADIYIINTCTVTHLGDRKSRQIIRRMSRMNPEAFILVTGCYAQVSPEDVLGIQGVDLVVGTKDRETLVDLVESTVKGRGQVRAVSDYTGGDSFEEFSSLPFYDRVRAYLKIQEGCSNFCTYCIVPYARGPLRSRRPEKIIEEARRIIKKGFNEIVITGIRTGAYGVDFENRWTLADLIRKLAEIPGLVRLRLSSIEPNDVTPELVETLAGIKNFCSHLHLPLQSGDDEILQRMGRRYNTWEYSRLVNILRENLPDLGLTTDIMVGFPGETGKNFDNNLRFVEKTAFSRLHVFKFSPRRGTPAASFSGQVDPLVKEERSKKMIQTGNKLSADFARAHLGTVLDVLAEQPFDREEKLWEGLTGNYLKVVFPGNEDVRGRIVKVTAGKFEKGAIQGRIINE